MATSGLSRKRRLSYKELKELTPSEYLRKYYNIVLPQKIAEFWDSAGYVEEDGLIDFESPDGELVSGYWESVDGAPFFDSELESYLSWYLFDRDPRYSIIACQPGLVCEIDENDGYFEFQVYDTEKHEYVFSGAIMGLASWKDEGDNSYVEFVPTHIVIRPSE